MIRVITILFSLVQFLVHGQTYTVETIPNIKLVNNSYVSNPDSILSEAAVNRINQKLTNLEVQTTVQVAVVVIQSIGNEDHVDFAQRLFNRWGIGHPGKNNGLLILMVMDQRTVRFHTGYGLEGVLPDIVCKHIQMERMIPYFKIEDYNSGMIDGVDEVVDVLSLPGYAQELFDNSQKEASGWNAFFWIFGGVWFFLMLLIYGILEGLNFFSTKTSKGNRRYAAMRPSRWLWLLLFWAMPIIPLIMFDYRAADFNSPIQFFLALVYVYLGFALVPRRLRMNDVIEPLQKKGRYFDVVDFYLDQQKYWLVMAITFPVPWLAGYWQYKFQMRAIRSKPRNCQSCNGSLRKLTESTEDAYLTASQIFEEQLGSVDYDVWFCPSCGKFELEPYIDRFKKYRICPSCKTLSFYNKGSRTVAMPTYTATGTGETTQECKYCHHKVVESFSIAMLEPPSSDSSSSSSDSSYSSSGSDSGGSWGGGSSGGGGASSSW